MCAVSHRSFADFFDLRQRRPVQACAKSSRVDVGLVLLPKFDRPRAHCRLLRLRRLSDLRFTNETRPSRTNAVVVCDQKVGWASFFAVLVFLLFR